MQAPELAHKEKRNIMAKEEKNSGAILYFEYAEHFDLLSREDRGDLVTAMLEYGMYGVVTTELSACARMAFSFIKKQMDRDADKYKEKCEKNSANGSRGGRPKKESSDEKPNGYFKDDEKPNGFSENPTKPNGDFRKPKKANKKEKENENKSENEKENINSYLCGDGDILSACAHTCEEIPPKSQKRSEELLESFYGMSDELKSQSIKEATRLFSDYFGRIPTPGEISTLHEYMQGVSFEDGKAKTMLHPKRVELCEYAFKQASNAGKRQLNYVIGVLDKLRQRHILTLEDAELYDFERDEKV